MENGFESTSTEKQYLFINDQCNSYLKEISKWTKFMSILGFLGIAFMVVASLFIGVVFSMVADLKNSFPFSPILFSALYLILAGVYSFPVYFLFKFSTIIQNALTYNNVDFLEKAFSYLKSHYKFIGIATITFIALYILLFVGMIVFGGIAALSTIS